MPVQRRLKLIEFAEKNDTYIIEDDYDSEFRYEGHPIRPLYELNPERVIYLGSFSKILAPALRLGFMIVPEKLFSSCKNLKAHTDVHSATVEQYTLASFIEKGFFEKHLWKMKKYYGRNRNHLLHTLQSHFGSRFNVLGHASGLHMAVQFKDVTFTKKITGEIAQEGVLIYPADNFYLHKQKKSTTDKIILGYSHLSADDITKGIATVSSVLCKQ